MTSHNKNVSHHTARASLLHVIGTEKPHSLQALADLVGRKQTNLSRTLKKLEEAGIVRLDPGPRHTVAPRLVAQRVTLDLDQALRASPCLIRRWFAQQPIKA